MKNKVYSFSTEDAVNYGIDAAVILHNMRYWLDYARAHGEMQHDGQYWMYATASKMTEVFPFWSANKIQKLLKKLEEDGVIISGNYSRSKFDRTKWFSLPEYSIQPNGGMRFSESAESLYDQYEDCNKGKEAKTKNFIQPSIEEVLAYMSEKGYPYKSEAEKFFYYYDSKGWMVGKSKMKNWKSSVAGWLGRCGLKKVDTAKPVQQKTNVDEFASMFEEMGK